MKKNILKVATTLIALLIIPSAIFLTNEFQQQDMRATAGGMKTTISPYDKVMVGGKSYTALTPTSFLINEPVGGAMTRDVAANAVAAWVTTGDFSNKERPFLKKSALPTMADLPIVDNLLNNTIPALDGNWWLNDRIGGVGENFGFVDSANRMNSGYDREIAVNTGTTTCGTRTERVSGGLNTSEYTGPGTTGLRVINFIFYNTSNTGTYGIITNALPLSDGRPEGTIIIDAGKNTMGDSATMYASSTDFTDPIILDYIDISNNSSCYQSEIATGFPDAYGSYKTFCDGRWKIKVKGNISPPTPTSGSGYISSSSVYTIGANCPGIKVPVATAYSRPLMTTNFSDIFSMNSNPKAGVSDILEAYPDAGIGPYTLQLSDTGLKVKLDSSVQGVSGNTIEVDATTDGKISIPYDISGSTYDSVEGDAYISAMNNGNYAKLGTATKNGKGTVVLDVNNLVTKTNGKINTQTITFDLYQEEITKEGYTNYISNPTTITMNIKGMKEEQAPFTINNESKLPYTIEQPNFSIITSGGSGSGGITYAIKADPDHIASISNDTISYIKAGTITITATKAGDDTYSAITAEKSITIEKVKQVLTITNTDFKLGSASNFKIMVDGRPSSLTQPLTYALAKGEGDVASISGDTITPIKAGAIEITVTSKGDAIYEDCIVKKAIQFADKDPQIPLQITNTDVFTYDINKPNFEVTTSGGSGIGTISYKIKEDIDSIASISGNTVTYTKAGTFTITATKASDDTYQESVAEKTFTINKIKQTLTITNTDFKIGTANDFKVQVEGRSNSLTQPLQYELTLGKDVIASITNDTITPIKAGMIEISVTSPGDDIYEDFIITKQIQLIEKNKQTPLVITNTDSFTYDKDNANFEITTSGGSGTGGITYAIKEDSDHIASISGNTITYTKAGSFTITATKAGDDTYQESTAEKTFEIKKIKQVLMITNGTFVIGTASNFKINVEGRETSLLQPLVYDITIGKDDIASITNDTITPIKAGMIEISVTSSGDDVYEDLTITKQINLVEKENQTPLVITNTEKRVYDRDALSFDITTSGGSGSGAMTYEIVEDVNHIASISGKTITYVKPGTFTIRAMKASDSAYKESIAEKTITIEKMKQEDFAISNTDFIITSAANFTITTINRPSELSDAIIYDISVGKDSVASIVDDVVTPITTGNITITATSKGNTFYEDCTVEKQIAITRLPIQNPEISIRNGASVVYGSNNNNLQILTTGGQGNGAITYEITPTDVASIDDTSGLVTIKKVGTFTVTATKSGSGVYSNSIARKTIVVEQGEQTAFEISNTDFIYASAPDFKITTRGRLNELTEPLVYDVTQGKGDVVRIVADTITPLKVGEITISVNSKGNENYKDKTVEKQISITNLPAQDMALDITNTDVTWGDNNNTLQIATSGGQGEGAITYELQAGDEDIASIDHNSGLVQIKKVGIFHVTATKSGNGIFQDAQASKTITVNPMDITITPKPITKKVHQTWTSIFTFDYDVSPALIPGDTLLGNAIYAYANGVDDDSPVGTYTYTIRGLSSPNYAITFEEGTLYVEKDILDKDELAAYYRIKSGTKGLQGWYTSNVVFESLKKNGYDLISDTQTFLSSEFMVSKEGSFTNGIYFKNNNGSITEPIQVPLKIDKSAPIMEEIILREKNTNALAKFINNLSFGNWFKQEVEVEFIGTDNLSDVTFLYQEEINGVLGAWKTTSDTLSYQNGASVILHVKALDEAGNESVDTLTSDFIQIDLDAPIISGVVDKQTYYLPKLVTISDANSGINFDASYFVNGSQKDLYEQTLFNGIGNSSLHVEDHAGNTIDVQFNIQGLPPLDSIVDDDASRDIVKEVEKEYDDIKDSLTDEKQKQEIEDWIEKAKDKSKKYVDVIEEEKSGIIVDGDGSIVFEEDIELVVEVVTTKIQNEKIDLEKFEGLDKDDEIKVAYDIYLKKGDEKIQPQGIVKVKIPNTKELQQIEGLKLVYIDDDNVATLYPSTIDKDYINFSTDHFSNYAIVGKRSKLNIDVDKDGVLDLNIDTDKDGLPDLNLDSDDDGEADLNVDSNGDFIPDIDIDTNGDGKADVNIDVNGDGVADLNIAQRITSWKPDKDCTVNGFAYDTDGSIIANINVDSDGDGEADTNIDTDGDGTPDANLDDYWKNILPKNNTSNDLNGIGGVMSGDESRWTSWWITVVLALSTMIASQILTKKWKVTKKQK